MHEDENRWIGMPKGSLLCSMFLLSHACSCTTVTIRRVDVDGIYSRKGDRGLLKEKMDKSRNDPKWHKLTKATIDLLVLNFDLRPKASGGAQKENKTTYCLRIQQSWRTNVQFGGFQQFHFGALLVFTCFFGSKIFRDPTALMKPQSRSNTKLTTPCISKGCIRRNMFVNGKGKQCWFVRYSYTPNISSISHKMKIIRV